MIELLQQWVTAQAARRPEATAVVLGPERLSYAELDQASNRLARHLQTAGCARGDRVCLLMPKSPAAIVALLAVLKADAIYVPLDPASPAARLSRILNAADARWMLAGGGSGGTAARLVELLELTPQGSRPIIGWIGEEARPSETAFGDAEIGAASVQPLAAANGPGDPAHILFTSGSTGAPKGVVITHDNVRQFVNWAVGYFGTLPGDRISGHPPLHFDLSTFDIFATFAAGAELHLVPPDLSLVPHRLAAMIRSSELTQWFSVPAVFNYLAKYDAIRPGDFPSLRRVLWCGEVLPTPTLMYWMQRLPHAQFTNLYGPTETTIASSYYTVPRCPTNETEAIPIGQACAGETLEVLGADEAPAAAGDTGDLYISGVGLSPGYWRDPVQTAAAFRATGDGTRRRYRTGDLARVGSDGLVYFLGRADTQIKSRGYRIELGEVEAALHALPQLRESAVVAIESGGFEGTVICAACVAADGVASPRAADLRRALGGALPGYMLPSRWQFLPALPKNANGKIDRPGLRELFRAAPGSSD